jgi:hypothetical protein
MPPHNQVFGHGPTQATHGQTASHTSVSALCLSWKESYAVRKPPRFVCDVDPLPRLFSFLFHSPVLLVSVFMLTSCLPLCSVILKAKEELLLQGDEAKQLMEDLMSTAH